MAAPNPTVPRATTEAYESFPPPSLPTTSSSGAAGSQPQDGQIAPASQHPPSTRRSHESGRENPSNPHRVNAPKRWYQDKRQHRRLWWSKFVGTLCILVAWIAAAMAMRRRILEVSGMTLALYFGITPWLVLWIARILLIWPLLYGHHMTTEVVMMIVTGGVGLVVLAIFIAMTYSKDDES